MLHKILWIVIVKENKIFIVTRCLLNDRFESSTYLDNIPFYCCEITSNENFLSHFYFPRNRPENLLEHIFLDERSFKKTCELNKTTIFYEFLTSY